MQWGWMMMMMMCRIPTELAREITVYKHPLPRIVGILEYKMIVSIPRNTKYEKKKNIRKPNLKRNIARVAGSV